MKKLMTVPNLLTALRIAGALALIWIEPLSALFFVVYTISGVSDALDGPIARATGSASELGARLDSAADLLFYVVMMLRILPELVRRLPGWIWYWVGVILVLRVATYVTAALRFRCFAALHTYFNKLTGFAVFLVPYFTLGAALTGYCIAVCVVGSLSSAEEWLLHLTAKRYDPERKTLLPLGRGKRTEK